jgi:cysteine-S-conjugate beta-lyase
MTSDRQHLIRSMLVRMGRHDGPGPQPVNPAVIRASTYLHDSTAHMREAEQDRAAGKRTSLYGRRGTETGFALEDALVVLEGGFGARLTSSGLAANTLVFLAYARPGDHVVISDGVYAPVRRFAKKFLTEYKIEHTFAKADGSDLESKLRDDTALIYWEMPGSVLFEIADLPRICALARRSGAIVAVDNTWGSALHYHPLALGADVSAISATKYLCGHSDVLFGAVVANERAWPALNDMAEWMGHSASPDDAYAILRGMRTLAVRLDAHEAQARKLIAWFRAQPFVDRIFYPPAEDHPGHELWRRDFSGACGLFAIEFRRGLEAEVEAFADHLTLFGIGSSWGGYESLARVETGVTLREVSSAPAGPVVRFHAGFEDIVDLLSDLESACSVFRGVAS